MEVRYRESFLRDLKKLKKHPLYDKIVTLAFQTLPDAEALTAVPGVKAMTGHPHRYRIRVGSRRVGIQIDGAWSRWSGSWIGGTSIGTFRSRSHELESESPFEAQPCGRPFTPPQPPFFFAFWKKSAMEPKPVACLWPSRYSSTEAASAACWRTAASSAREMRRFSGSTALTRTSTS